MLRIAAVCVGDLTSVLDGCRTREGPSIWLAEYVQQHGSDDFHTQ